MALFQSTQNKLVTINELPFKLEKDIQRLIESNLESLINLLFVKSEFIIKGKRIDTLAFDSQTNGFVIIEYKRDRNISVIDQGFSYLSLMLENKAEFIVEYNESLRKNLKREDVDWSQSRVVFVAPSFTENQKLATNFEDVAIDLWEVKKYENNLISFSQIRKTSKESIKQIAEVGGEIEEVSKEIKVYGEDDHIAKGSDEIKELYQSLKARLVELPDVEISPTKVYLGFKLNNKVITDVDIRKNSIKQRINLKKGILDDPRNIFYDVSAKGHWGVGDYEANLSGNDVDIDYIMSLVKQAYHFHKKSNSGQT
jgi:predicted transport protein